MAGSDADPACAEAPVTGAMGAGAVSQSATAIFTVAFTAQMRRRGSIQIRYILPGGVVAGQPKITTVEPHILAAGRDKFMPLIGNTLTSKIQ